MRPTRKVELEKSTKSARILLFVIPFLMLALIGLASHRTVYGLKTGKNISIKTYAIDAQQYKARILARGQDSQQFNSDGEIILFVRPICVRSDYIFGYRYSGSKYYEEAMIEITRDGAVIKQLSLRDIDGLPKNDSGHYQFSF
jgi:hypothetical protein